MKNLQHAASVQGMLADQTAFAPVSTLDGSPKTNFQAQSPRFFRIFLCFFALVSSAFVGYSQQYATVDVADYDYAVVVPNITLDSGDVVDVIVQTGQQIEDAIGLDISFNVSSNAHFPNPPAFEFDESWLLDTPNLSTTVTTNSGTGLIRLEAERTDAAYQAGQGELYRLSLTAAVNNVHASDLIAAAGGGTIMVENLDFKTAPGAAVTTLPNLRAFPNPCSDVLHIEWDAELPVEAILLGPGGAVIRRFRPSGQQESLDVRILSEGLYILRMVYADRPVVHQRILVRH